MANNYTEFSETLDSLTPVEEAWFNEQFSTDPATGGPLFLADYENRDPDDPDYGFCICFGGEGGTRHLLIYSDVCGDVGRVAHLMQKFLKQFRPGQWWSLTYANTCSKPGPGQFGGGAIFVTADGVNWESTYDVIDRQKAAFEARKSTHAQIGE